MSDIFEEKYLRMSFWWRFFARWGFKSLNQLKLIPKDEEGTYTDWSLKFRKGTFEFDVSSNKGLGINRDQNWFFAFIEKDGVNIAKMDTQTEEGVDEVLMVIRAIADPKRAPLCVGVEWAAQIVEKLLHEVEKE